MRCFENSRFAGYDNQGQFLKLRNALESHGFEDVTYNNDVCPSVAYGHYDDTHIELKVFVDYLQPEEREVNDASQFTVTICSDDPDIREEFIRGTDHYELAISAAIEAKQKLDVQLEDVFNLFKR